MTVRFAIALEISTDELLGLQSQKPGHDKKQARSNGRKPGRKILLRPEQIEDLSTHQRAVLLKTIDIFIKAAAK